ncbi:hypothetical protein A4X06_0g1056 [Tilletia controversa]|uniref:Uncharacterized protein n=1 Tax=Tilletia controversa TaxID=13291 RepID=A0A8X7SZY4_9BASI|nr:hypothetical protein CF328_g819 [Tilletia controversa]KAE8254102.1 hypothetical protein A4X06_0g1056 [Tilletia controversa]
MAATKSLTCVDNTSFGPGSPCRNFDFSLLFENTILVLLPNVVFIALFGLIRLPRLLHKSRVRPPAQDQKRRDGVWGSTFGLPLRAYVPNDSALKVLDRPLEPQDLPLCIDWLGVLRILFAVIGVALAAALLGLSRNEVSDPSIKAALGGWSFAVAQVLHLVGAIVLAAAVWTERLFTKGGSFLVPLFVLCSILFDGARLRTFNMVDIPLANDAFVQYSMRATSFFRVFAASIGIKVLLIATESINTDGGETAEGRATWFNRLGFFWLFPLMLTGFRKALKMEDLPRLDGQYSTSYLSETFSGVWSFAEQTELRRQGKKTRSFLWAIVCAFPYVVYGPIIAKVAVTAVTLAQPYLISDVIQFVEGATNQQPGGPPPRPAAWGWSLAGAFALCYTVNAVGSGWYWWATAQNGATLRGLIVGQLYAKSLRLHLAEAGALGSAGAVNLMSADVQRIVSAVDPLHEFWSGVIIIGVGLYILHSQMGTVFLVPLIATFALLGAAPLLGSKLGKMQKEWSGKIDQRLAVTSSMINGIKAVKMAGFESFFEKKLTALRDTEMKSLFNYMMSIFSIVVVTNVGQGLLTAVTFGALAIACFECNPDANHDDRSTIRQSFCRFAAYSSFKRIEKFLLSEEMELGAQLDQQLALPVGEKQAHKELHDHSNLSAPTTVKYENLTLQWSPKGDTVLRGVTINFKTGITMVIGPLSCGKSTLLSAALAEPYVACGTLTSPATATNRTPIAYSSQDCWMQETLSLRANIVFHSDQPFDQEWYDAVVSACCLRDDFAVFASGDKRLAKSLSGGQKQRSSGLLRNKIVILASNALHRLKNVDWVVRLGNGTVLQQGPPTQVKLSEDEIRDLEAAQKATSKALKGSAMDDLDENEDEDIVDSVPNDKLDADADADGNEIEDVEEGEIKMKFYYWWLQCAGYGVFSVMLIAFVLGTAALLGTEAYLQSWTVRSAEDQRANFGPLLGGLLAILGGYLVMEGLNMYTCIAVIPPGAGKKLHSRLLHGILSAPLSFFSERSSGQILNRFSQDLFAADDQWMMHLGNFISTALSLIGSVILMVVSAPYLLIVIAAVSVLVVLLRKYYLPNSRQLRRLEMSSKSPLYTLFGDSTTGLSVIRAFGRQKTLSNMNVTYMDAAQRPYYALSACRRWLLVWTNASAMICNTALVLIVVGLRTPRIASVVGVALAQTVNISFTLTQLVMAWCEAEIAGVVFERLYEFSTTPSEQFGAATSPTSTSAEREKALPMAVDLPSPGAVEFRDVVLSYTPGEGEPVLKSLSFSLAPGEHLGICGRTGSGKSTILLALLRMVERQSGDIRLGGQPIDKYELHQLRRSVAVVGQDPLIVNGASVRENLTLEGELPEDRIWQVLRDVQLADYVKALPEGLDAVLDNKTARLSQGRRQLLTIARVLLNPKQVVILDEVTSAIDEETDAIVQRLLRTEFRSSTVISIAHRTASIVQYDRMMVLGGGTILEMGPPDVLLARSGGAFRSLAVHQGVV